LPGAVWTMIRTGQFFLKRETILETNRSPGHGITWYYMVLHGITPLATEHDTRNRNYPKLLLLIVFDTSGIIWAPPKPSKAW
jgi:hypothetical protein